MQSILDQEQEQEDEDEDEIAETDSKDMSTSRRSLLHALIVTPTRELATQIQAECEKLIPNKCVTLVGGIAQVKQQRLLQTKRPPIVIGTPGRLWAMVRQTGSHPVPGPGSRKITFSLLLIR